MSDSTIFYIGMFCFSLMILGFVLMMIDVGFSKDHVER